MKVLKTAALLAFALVASTSFAQTIKIGFITSYSGLNGNLGPYMERAVRLYESAGFRSFGIEPDAIRPGLTTDDNGNLVFYSNPDVDRMIGAFSSRKACIGAKGCQTAALSHSRSSVLTANGDLAQSTLGLRVISARIGIAARSSARTELSAPP